MMRHRVLLLVPLLILAAAAPALAWGTKGHTWVVQNAIKLLPEGQLKDFLSSREATVSMASLKPDFQWQEGDIREYEGPNHYIDLDAISDAPSPDDLPRARIEAARMFTELGLSYRDGGFLPWRIEEGFVDLLNALKTNRRNAALFAGVLAHYVADATQPLHTTIHYDGRVDEQVGGEKLLRGIHYEYEIVFIEDHGFDFRAAPLQMAEPPQVIDDVWGTTVDTIFGSFSLVDPLYAVTRANQGEGKYDRWNAEMGDMTRGQLAKAATLLASLWLSAYEQAGRPDLPN